VRFVILLKCLHFFCGTNRCILQSSSGNAFLLILIFSHQFFLLSMLCFHKTVPVSFKVLQNGNRTETSHVINYCIYRRMFMTRCLLCINYNNCHGNAVREFLCLWFALLTIKPLPPMSA
jgi:hypothetical protein